MNYQFRHGGQITPYFVGDHTFDYTTVTWQQFGILRERLTFNKRLAKKKRHLKDAHDYQQYGLDQNPLQFDSIEDLEDKLLGTTGLRVVSVPFMGGIGADKRRLREAKRAGRKRDYIGQLLGRFAHRGYLTVEFYHGETVDHFDLFYNGGKPTVIEFLIRDISGYDLSKPLQPAKLTLNAVSVYTEEHLEALRKESEEEKK